MLEKFGLEFKIVNTDYVKELRRARGIHANPWTSFPRLIASVDWIKSGEPLRMLRDVLPVRASYPRKFDLLVVDEAHNVAPAGSAHYVLDSQRTQVIRKIAPLSASTASNSHAPTTVTQNLSRPCSNAARMISGFLTEHFADEKQRSQVMIRRLKTDLVDKHGNPIYPKRTLQALSVPYTADERAIHKVLDAYCKSREKTCQKSGVTGTKFVNSILKKRFFSSPSAFASTLEKHFSTLTSGASAAQAGCNDRPHSS